MTVRARRWGGRGGQAGQTGVTLVEVLVVTLVVAPLVLAASAGMFAAVTASTNTRDRQALDAALSSYADSVKAMPYLACGSASAYRSAYASWSGRWSPDPGSGISAGGLGVSSVQYWDQSTAGFRSTCTSDGGAQRITLVVIKDRDSMTGTVVKRNPDAMPGTSP